MGTCYLFVNKLNFRIAVFIGCLSLSLSVSSEERVKAQGKTLYSATEAAVMLAEIASFGSDCIGEAKLLDYDQGYYVVEVSYSLGADFCDNSVKRTSWIEEQIRKMNSETIATVSVNTE